MAGKEDKKDREDKEERVREQPVTYEAYAEMPDDGNRYEIFDGVLEMMSPAPSFAHQVVGGELEWILKQSCSSEYLILHAPLDVILSRTNVLQPDVIAIHRSRMEIVTMRGIEGAPDLVVEVLSPGSRSRDKVRKLKIYAKHRVPEYWIVDTTARTLERYVLTGEAYELEHVYEGDERVASDKLPCAAFAVSELFRDPSLQKLQSLN